MNTSPMQTIRLYGELGAKFGRVHRAHLDTNTPAEAVRYLRSQFPGIDAYLCGAKDKGVAFAVFRGKENITREQLTEPAGNGDIRIAPIIMGSKRAGALQTILGVVMMAVAVFIVGVSWGTLSGPGFALFSMGAAMAAGGIVQMLSPQPKFGGAKESSNQPSYVFNGAVNTEAQGHPVPLLYGRMRVGSAVISAGIEAAAYAPATPGAGPGTPGGNNKKNFYEA